MNPELSYFKRIIPCGLVWAEVTSMAKELGQNQSVVEVRDKFLRHFAEIFSYSEITEGLEWPYERNDLNFLNGLNDLNS